jgi:hypothetical protein
MFDWPPVMTSAVHGGVNPGTACSAQRPKDARSMPVGEVDTSTFL